MGWFTGAELVVKDNEEYSLTVDAAKSENTDGYNTKYTGYPTRNISTLKNYVEDTEEVDLYDKYGGYTGGEKIEHFGSANKAWS